ncbi:hypothetical protein GCM10028798_14470 [Humibacter antri]
MGDRYVHVITPGDHFSPATGSAIPTVVDGLSAASAGGASSSVVVARGTFANRYPSAEVIEYAPVRRRRFDRYLDAGFSRVLVPRRRARREWAATVSIQGTWAPSVVFAHNGPQLIPSVDARRHAPVLYAHNNVLRTYSRRESGRVLAQAELIVCVSSFLMVELAASLPPALQQRIEVVHNGVDTERFHPRSDPERGDRLRVAFVGRVIRDKGPDVLLEALRLLDRADIVGTIIGASGFSNDAPLSSYERSLRELAAPLGQRATMTPFLSRAGTAELLREFDVVVVPSRWREPYALTVLEAMASGAAVIASDIGGIPEAAGPAGMLVPPGDANALAGAIASLADDESLRRRVAAAGLAHARAQTWSTARAELDAALRRTLAI